jgi:hypothetical protein
MFHCIKAKLNPPHFMSTISSSTAPPILNKASLYAALAGAVGGFVSFLVGEVVNSLLGGDGAQPALQLVFGSAAWSGAIGLVIGCAILIYDNSQSLRGQWHRDLVQAAALFFGLSFLGGAAGQISYSFVQNSLTRGVGWALMGVSIGVGMGLLRRDMTQAVRGAVGGAIGGFGGGLIFDSLANWSGTDGRLSRVVGQILMGALIALMMRVVQDAFKSAWLLGISSGPFEGKEYPLNTARVSVGRAAYNDISLFREESTPPHVGALTFYEDNWWWQGENIGINGISQSGAVLNSGDTLQIGATSFRFQTRSVKNPVVAQGGMAPVPPYTPPIPAYSSAAPTAAPVAQNFGLMLPSGQLLNFPPSLTSVHVGRSSQNQLVLPESTVSSNHAVFHLVPGRLSITDHSSTNGTFVNGTKLTPGFTQPLNVGDHVRFGTLETVVRSV